LTITITPYKRIGKISLFLKDSITGMNDILAKESVDVIVTSPPKILGLIIKDMMTITQRKIYTMDRKYWLNKICFKTYWFILS
jgi:DNA modification methylase